MLVNKLLLSVMLPLMLHMSIKSDSHKQSPQFVVLPGCLGQVEVMQWFSYCLNMSPGLVRGVTTREHIVNSLVVTCIIQFNTIQYNTIQYNTVQELCCHAGVVVSTNTAFIMLV